MIHLAMLIVIALIILYIIAYLLHENKKIQSIGIITMIFFPAACIMCGLTFLNIKYDIRNFDSTANAIMLSLPIEIQEKVTAEAIKDRVVYGSPNAFFCWRDILSSECVSLSEQIRKEIIERFSEEKTDKLKNILMERNNSEYNPVGFYAPKSITESPSRISNEQNF